MRKIEVTLAAKVLPLAMALALVATDAQALGLGTLEVKSQLNQPLVAEIPLIGVGPGELDALSVRLASPEAFDRVGLPRPAGVTANLQFSVGRNARGEPVVRVTTSNRVDDPFVAFLLEADWGKGSVVREFTALVDPPHIAAATVTPMTAPTVAAPPASTAAPMTAPAAAPEPAPVSEPATALAAEPSTAQPEALPPEPAPAPAPPPAPPPAAAPAPVAAAPAPQPAPEPTLEPALPEPPPVPTPVAAEAPPAPAPAPSIPAATPGQREVASGETLWRIASEQRQRASMAQMMLAIQRANPDAFLRDNINLLRKGAVLRIPTPEEVRDLASAEAEARVREQMAAWRAIAPGPAPTPGPGDSPATALPPAATAQAPARPSAPVNGTAPGARLEIAPPAGAGAAGAQSGASSGGSGSELRAELEQAREDLSARDAELRELRSRLSEQEALANEQERLIQLKDSQLSAMEEALRRDREGESATPADPSASALDPAPSEVVDGAASPVAATTPEPEVPAPANEPTVAPEPPVTAGEALAADATPTGAALPWFRQPLVLGGAGILLVGGLVGVLLRRRRAAPKAALPSVAAATAPRSRLSDDSDFLSNLPPPASDIDADDAPAHEATDLPAALPQERGGALGPDAVASASAPAASPVVRDLQRNVDASPADLDAHVALLRQLYNAGDADGFLEAAERMRARVEKPADSRWREVVVMGMGLVPGHALFRELQWNPVSAVDVRTAPPSTPSSTVPSVLPDGFDERETAERPAFELAGPEASGLDDTRLELAKAYIEIGDTDGARGMLEEVLAEGSPAARSEAERLLKQIG